MANSFALMVQQRPMTAEEIADERKASEMAAHSPQVAKYMPGGQFGPRGKHAFNTKALKTIQSWEQKQARKLRERKRLPDLAKSESIEAYVKARRRAYD